MPRTIAPILSLSVAVAALIVNAGGRNAVADIVYSDGLNHVVTTTVNDRFFVTSNSTMTLGVGGVVLPPAPQGAQSVYLSQGTLVLSGGTIGGSFYGVSGASNATFNATSGQVNGGANGGSAVWLASGGGNINGGTFNGGDFGGNALILDSGSLPSSLNTTINGGTFQGGANTIGQGGSALFLTAFGTNILAINGGVFNGGTGTPPANLGAALRVFTSPNPVLDKPLVVTVAGGQFNGSIDIRGLYKSGTVNFLGTGLSFSDNGDGTGFLRGTLQDGDSINSRVLDTGDAVLVTPTFVQFSGTAFTAVPEPSSLVLSAATLLAVTGYLRFRRGARAA